METTNKIIINTGHVVFSLAVLATIAAWPRLQQIQIVNQARSERAAPERKVTESGFDQVRLLQSRHKLAIERARSGACVLMVDAADPTKTVHFSEVTNAISRTTGQKLTNGQLVCNELGETGVVAMDGTIQGFAVVAPKDMAEFKELMGL